MYLNPVLIAQFDQLTAQLTVHGLDLPRAVQSLEDAATLAVRSLLGWSLAVCVDGGAIKLTSIQPSVEARDVRASLQVPLRAFINAELDGNLVFYAAAPHAFTRLAADLTDRFHSSKHQLHIDQDLNPDLTPGLTGVRTCQRSTRQSVS